MTTERTWLHRLDPRVKLAWSATVALSATLLGQPPELALLLGLTLVPWLVLRPPWRYVLALLSLAGLALGSMLVSQGLFWNSGPRTVVLTLPLGLSLAREGLLYGAGQSLRLVAIGSAALAVVACSEPAALLFALTRLGLPPGPAFMLVLALRFLPETLAQGQRILAIQRLRGVRGGALRRASHFIPPLVACLLRQARQMALAADARAWTPRRRELEPAPLARLDRVVLAGLVVLLLAASAVGGSG